MNLTAQERKRLCRRVLRLGVPARHCEDVVQNVAIGLWRADIRIPEGKSAAIARRDVLFGITLRQVANHRRREARARLVLVPEAGKRVLVRGAEERALAAAGACELAAALEELRTSSPEYHALLVGYYLDERPAEELAATMGVNINTCWTRLRLARRAVRELLRLAQVHEADRAASAINRARRPRGCQIGEERC